MANFVFVHCNDPDSIRKSPARKAVRAQAASYGHLVAPRPLQEPTQQQSSQGIPDRTASASQTLEFWIPPRTSTPQVASDASTTPTGVGSSSHPWDKSQPRKRRESASTALTVLQHERNPPQRTDNASSSVPPNVGRKRQHKDTPSLARDPSERRKHAPSLMQHLSEKRRRRRISTSVPRMPNIEQILFETHGIQHRPYFTWLLNHWYGDCMLNTRALDAFQPKQIEAYGNWSRGFELGEPALFYASLFFASGTPTARTKISDTERLWLRGEAVKALNEALDHPMRATSNAIIMAVGKVAMYEFMHGDRQAAQQVHRVAQRRMINMRGGATKLGLPPITLQLMAWSDAVVSRETGETPMALPLKNREQATIESSLLFDGSHASRSARPKEDAIPRKPSKLVENAVKESSLLFDSSRASQKVRTQEEAVQWEPYGL